MTKILVAECKQEVSSFNPVPSTYADFTTRHGQEILDQNRGGMSEMAGALSVFDQSESVDLVPTYSVRSRTSAGTLAQESFERIANEFLAAVRQAGTVDAVYYSLHGAMAAAEEPDPEGYLLQETRKILGDDIPIVISLDLHAVLTDRMLENCDGLTTFHTYPHVDMHDTGVRAARLLMRILEDGVRPVVSRVFIPALVRGDELITETGLLGQFIRRAQEVQVGPKGLAAGMLIGNPFTDVPELGSCSYVITDGDAALAQREALALADAFWQVRERLQWPLASIDEAMAAVRDAQGTVILTDAADAPSSGATGDSNELLRALLEAGIEKRVLLPIVDAPAVRAASEAGVGASITVSLGGTLDPGRFEPLTVKAKVRILSDGAYRGEYSGRSQNAGPVAVLELGSVIAVVTSRTVSLTDRSLFLGHGQNPKDFHAVVVKSPHCRKEFFSAWAERVVSVDAAGSTSANLPTLGHQLVRRPIFPLDPGFIFEPKAQLFR